MRVEYFKPVLEKIEEAIVESKKENKKIEKIWLNEKEWTEFCCWVLKNTGLRNLDGRWEQEALRNMTEDIYYDGITIGLEVQ